MDDKTVEFQVGDKVIMNNSVGTVVAITPKRKDIKVDFGNYTLTFGFDGWTHGDIWNMKRLEKWTPERQREIDDVMAIAKCKNLFDEARRKNKITPDAARAIIEILECVYDDRKST